MGLYDRKSYYEVIEEQKVTIADLQKENETLKATIAREKVASIELEASYKDDIKELQYLNRYQFHKKAR